MLKNITFCTKRDHNLVSNTIKISKNLNPAIEFVINNIYIPIDTENNSLIPLEAIQLLLQIGNKESQIVIDMNSFTKDELLELARVMNNPGKLYIGHSLKYDLEILKLLGFNFPNMYDTMLGEQCLRRGVITSNDLATTYKRRLNKYMLDDKSIRNDFINMDRNSLFKVKHISYSAGDVMELVDIMMEQRKLIKKYNINRSIYQIENPFIHVLAEMELEGIKLNEKEWLKLLDSNKKRKYKLELIMDDHIRKINRTAIKGLSRKREKKVVTQLDAFSISNNIELTNQNINHINYSSSLQLKNLFIKLNQPLPYKEEKGLRRVSFDKDSLETYLIERPFSEMSPLIINKIEHGETSQAISTFGNRYCVEKFKKKGKKELVRGFKSPITGKIHTIFRQATAKNNRLQSGDEKLGFPNLQNQKKDKRYRVCYTLTDEEIFDGWKILTIDYSSAELIILGALANDKKLISINKEDIHSYLATSAFKKIAKYIISESDNKEDEERYLHYLLKVNKVYNSVVDNNDVPVDENTRELITQERIKLIRDIDNFKIDKKSYPDIRNAFKNVVYGVSYGATSHKIAKALYIPIKWAELVIEALKEEIPDTFKYLEEQSELAVSQGYIIFNKRTNSRHIFNSAVNCMQFNRPLSFKEKNEMGREAKNYTISGTQADMIKEAGVRIYNWKVRNKINLIFLLQVHDEYVMKIKESELYNYNRICETVSYIMNETANQYLNGITKMNCEYNLLNTWTK